MKATIAIVIAILAMTGASATVLSPNAQPNGLEGKFMHISSAKNVGAPDPKLEANKKTVLDFYEAAINKRDFDAASKFIGERYVQHNPLIADGLDGFRVFLSYLQQTFPKLRAEIKNVFADGDFVIVHDDAATTRC